MPEWMQRIAERVYREYDRRIKRASLITAYGAATHDVPVADVDEDDEGVEIVNVPRGTSIAAPRRSDDTPV